MLPAWLIMVALSKVIISARRQSWPVRADARAASRAIHSHTRCSETKPDVAHQVEPRLPDFGAPPLRPAQAREPRDWRLGACARRTGPADPDLDLVFETEAECEHVGKAIGWNALASGACRCGADASTAAAHWFGLSADDAGRVTRSKWQN